MPLRILLAVLVALVGSTSPARATGPQFFAPSGGGGGSGVVAKTCSAGDFFSAVDGGGNFTCSTPAAGSAAFSAITGSTNTTAAMVVGTGASLSTSGSGTIAATTATNLAANPSDCAADTYATTIAASGNLTCASITNASTTGTAANTPSTLVLRDGSGNFAAGTITAALTGNASTATALAADGANCSAGEAPRGVDASGAVQNCTAYLTAEVDGSTTNELQNIFQTVDAPSGTDPVADTTTDTLALAASGIVTITGDSATDTITIGATEVDGSTTNELQNIFQTFDTSSGTDPVADTTTDTLVMTGTAPVTVTGDSTADSVTFALADPSSTGASADCSANQFMRGIGANLQMSCAQPAFSDLSGSATDAQIPDTITINTAATATNNTLLAGRLGTANDTIISTNGDGTIYGSGATLKDLTLRANDDDTTTGEIYLVAGAVVVGTTSAPTSGYEFDLTGDADLNGTVRIGASTGTISADDALVTMPLDHDFQGTAADYRIMQLNPTVHIGQAAGLLGTYSAVSSSGMTVAHDDTTDTNLPAFYLMIDDMSTQRSVASSATLSTISFVDASDMTGSNTVSNSGHTTLYGNPAIVASGATSHTASSVTGFSWAPAVQTNNAGGTSTITTLKGVNIADVGFSGAGTEVVTTQVGIEVAALSNGGTNIGIRNADTTVNTPTTQTIGAASDTISPTASLVCLNATANRNLSSTPHISDGVSGQVLTVMNCDTSTETIQLNDQSQVASSGLQLTANSNVILNAGESVTLVYTAAGGASDWFEISRTAPYQTTASMVIQSDVTQVNYFCGPGFDCNATETAVDTLIPTDITLTGLSCEQKDDTSCTVVFTVRDDAANTAATCTTTNADVCTWNGSVAVAAGSLLDIQITSWTSCTNNSDINCAITYTRP